MSFYLRLAVITRFGPDREWELPIVEESLKRLEAPQMESRLIFCDSSKSSTVREKAFSIGEGWGEFLYVPFQPIAGKDQNRPRLYSYFMASLHNQMARATRNAPYVFTLDSDTLIPSKEELGGETVLLRMQKAMTGDVAVVGSVLHSRHKETIAPSVYRMDSIEPFQGFHYAVERAEGLEAVDAFATACTLWNGELFRLVGFEGCPNLTGKELLGWEWYFHKITHLLGYKSIVDWSIKTKHYKTPWSFV